MHGIKRGINSTNLKLTEWPGRDVFSDGDVSDRGEIIPVEQKSQAGMNLAGGNNPCGEKEESRDAFSRPK